MHRSRGNRRRGPYPSERSRAARRPHHRNAPEVAIQSPPAHATRSPNQVTIVLRSEDSPADAAAASGLVGPPPLAWAGSTEFVDGEPTWDDAEWQ